MIKLTDIGFTGLRLSSRLLTKTFIAAVAAITLLTAGCASKPEQKSLQTFIGEYPTINTTLFAERSAIQQNNVLDIDTLTRLSEPQKTAFLDWYNAPEQAEMKAHHRLYAYLEKYTKNFHFRGETYNATTAIEQNSGNCMSLALVTTALAELAGVEISYQKVHAMPVYEKFNDLITLSHHVRTHLYDPTVDAKSVFEYYRPRLVIDYFPNNFDILGKALSQYQFYAMYYRNLAVDALVKNDLDSAFWLAEEARSLAPHDGENLNLTALIHRRAGDVQTAAEFYIYGMKNVKTNTNIPNNYAILLDANGDSQAAEAIRNSIVNYNNKNPYAWLKLGYESAQKNNDLAAIRYFNKAIEIAPYLDELYFALAKSLYRERRYSQAATAMETAAEKSWKKSKRSLYYAKLSALKMRVFE